MTRAPQDPGPLRAGLLAAATALALSPVLVDLVAHQLASAWSRYALVFPPLLLWCALREGRRPQPRADGYAWIALAMAVELLALAAGTPRNGRPAIPLAAIGVCRVTGLASLRCALLSFWWVPVPAALFRAASGVLLPCVSGAARLVSALGGTLTVEGGRVAGPAGALAFDKTDLGFPLAALLSGLAWAACLRARTPLPRALALTALWGVLGVLLGLLGFVPALALVAAGRPELGRALLSHGLWVAAAAAGVAYVVSRPAATSR